jgi:hypothetical protein
LADRLDWLGKDLRNLEVTEQHRSEFEAEDAALRTRLAQLRAAVRLELGIDHFMRSLRDSARDERVVIEGQNAMETGRPPVRQARIALRLRGSAIAVARLVRRIETERRLAVWERSTTDGPSAAIVTIYAMAAVPMPVYPDRCQPVPSRLWLWPYTAAIREQRGRLEQRCLEMKRHVATDARVLEMERQRNEVRALDELISRSKLKPAIGPNPDAPRPTPAGGA